MRVLLGLWLCSFSLLTFPLGGLALLFAGEGSAALDSHPENIGIVATAALLLIAWPVAAVVGIVAFVRDRPKLAWTVTGGTAGALLALGLLGVGVAVVAG